MLPEMQKGAEHRQLQERQFSGYTKCIKKVTFYGNGTERLYELSKILRWFNRDE